MNTIDINFGNSKGNWVSVPKKSILCSDTFSLPIHRFYTSLASRKIR